MESKKLFFGIKRDFLESIAVAEREREKDKRRRERRKDETERGGWGEGEGEGEDVEREHGGSRVLGRATVQGGNSGDSLSDSLLSFLRAEILLGP